MIWRGKVEGGVVYKHIVGEGLILLEIINRVLTNVWVLFVGVMGCKRGDLQLLIHQSNPQTKTNTQTYVSLSLLFCYVIHIDPC